MKIKIVHNESHKSILTLFVMLGIGVISLFFVRFYFSEPVHINWVIYLYFPIITLFIIGTLYGRPNIIIIEIDDTVFEIKTNRGFKFMGMLSEFDKIISYENIVTHTDIEDGPNTSDYSGKRILMKNGTIVDLPFQFNNVSAKFSEIVKSKLG